MGKYTGIIIVSDVDGTFRSREPNPESYEKNICAIEKFKAEGGIFTFATGRDFYSLKSVIPDAENIVNAPVIVANGSKLYDTSTGIHIIDARLNMTAFREFLKIIKSRYPEIGIRFSGGGGFVVPDELNDMIIEDVTTDSDKTILNKIIVVPIDDIDDMPKCVIVHNPEILEEVQKMGEEFDKGKNFYFSKSYERGLEVVNKDYTKGKTAIRFKEYLNINNSVLYAIGDYENDIDMILSADIGACPDNAEVKVKAVAKIITKCCDDGAIADLIEIIGRGI